MFTEKERAYMQSQHLARIATVSDDGQPDVAPVGFEIIDDRIYIGGRNNPATRKYRNVESGNTQVAIVFDDLASVNPWRPRGIRVYGSAELVEHDGYAGKGSYIRITPSISWSWSVEGSSMVDGKFRPHRTVHEWGTAE